MSSFSKEHAKNLPKTEAQIFGLPFCGRRHLCDEDETAAFARAAGRLLQKGSRLGLGGDLGSGKTFFARALIRSLCGQATVVPSPTFSLMQLYETPQGALYHFDFYRLKTPKEAWEIGLGEALAEGIVVAEWPERVASLISFDFLLVLEDSPRSPKARTLSLFSPAAAARGLFDG